MKQRLLFTFIAFSILLTSCGSDNGLIGNWKKSAEYSGSGRGGAVSFTIDDDVYVGLGYSNGDYFSSFYKYSSKNEAWGKITELIKDQDDNLIEVGVFPGEARRKAVAFSINGKGYIGTGVNEDNKRLKDFWEYDPSKPVAERWSEVSSLFPGEIRQGAVAFVINNVAYVGTGYGKLDGDDQSNLNDFYRFDGTTWSGIAFGGNKTSDAATFVIGDKAYLVSGVNNLDNVWEFDSTTESWTQKKDIDKDNKAENVQRTNAATFVIDGKGYIATGLGSNAREVWEYDPAKDDWVERTSLELEVISRIDAIGFSINNKGFIVAGMNGSTGLSDMWEFEPKRDETDEDND